MVQATEDGKGESFVIGLDDMFLFDRGWAFTSVSPGIGKETKEMMSTASSIPRTAAC